MELILLPRNFFDPFFNVLLRRFMMGLTPFSFGSNLIWLKPIFRESKIFFALFISTSSNIESLSEVMAGSARLRQVS